MFFLGEKRQESGGDDEVREKRKSTLAVNTEGVFFVFWADVITGFTTYRFP